MTTRPNSSDYKKHYQKFHQSISFAARTWHHHVHLQNRAAEDKNILDALNKAPRFWLDLRYSSVQTTIIFLGKIFDKEPNAYNVDKVLKLAHREKNYFSRESLRKRKIEAAGEFYGLDDYIECASELDEKDLKAINQQIKKAKTIWKSLKPLRDKIYAHNEVLSDSERESLYAEVKNSDLPMIIQILLNVSNALSEAEHNGKKPDFTHDHIQPITRAHKNIEELITSLLPKKNAH